MSNLANGLSAIQQLMGTRYVWGGNDESGIDCSGFTKYVYEAMGIDVPRVSFQQANAGQQITEDQARVGDLVWWDLNGRNPGADHVGIYMGNGTVAEASSRNGKVVVRNLWGDAHFTRLDNREVTQGTMSGDFTGMATTKPTAGEILMPDTLAQQAKAKEQPVPVGMIRPTKEMTR